MSSPAASTVEVTAAEEAQNELLRALGAVALTPPPAGAALCEALHLPVQSGADFTEVFVLAAPPHAAIHLGPEGKLGGEGFDRVAGFWRALGLPPPKDADHLGVLLMFLAHLGELAQASEAGPTRERLLRARAALFHEHIWSWAPGYLAAVLRLRVPTVAEWARLTRQALDEVHAVLPAPEKEPLALREAPAPLSADDSFDDTLDALVAPIRTGMILTAADLAVGAAQAGVGLRRGERRFALKAMLEQDAPATLDWLQRQASEWALQHRAGSADDITARWWADRASGTAEVLQQLRQLADQATDGTGASAPN